MEMTQDGENQKNRVNSGGIQTFNLSIQNLIGMNVGTLQGGDIDDKKVAKSIEMALLQQLAQLKGN